MLKQWIHVITDLKADAWGPAIKDTKERFKDNFLCALFGHPAFDGSEDEYFCERCFVSFKYPDEVQSKADFDAFILTICKTHKRRYSNG